MVLTLTSPWKALPKLSALPAARAGTAVRQTAQNGDQPKKVPGCDELAFTCFGSFEAAQTDWQALEASGAGSVYQRFDWCQQWYQQWGASLGSKPLIVVCYLGGRPALLLPLHTEPVFLGLRRASFMGNKHANIRMPLLTTDEAAALHLAQAASYGTLVAALRQCIAKSGCADHVHLSNMIGSFGGADNVLQPATNFPSVDRAFVTTVEPNFDAFARGRRGKDTLKKLRKKARALEGMGKVSFAKVSTADALAPTLEAFFEQKRERMNDIKLDNTFDRQENKAFVRALAAHSVQHRSRVLDIYTLTVDQDMVAMFAGGHFGGSFSGAITSMTSDPGYVKCSPGDVLLYRVLEQLCTGGGTSFDLGIGQASYKKGWCDPVDLRTLSLPISKAGHILAVATRARAWLRRRLLKNEHRAQHVRHLKFYLQKILARH